MCTCSLCPRWQPVLQPGIVVGKVEESDFTDGSVISSAKDRSEVLPEQDGSHGTDYPGEFIDELSGLNFLNQTAGIGQSPLEEKIHSGRCVTVYQQVSRKRLQK